MAHWPWPPHWAGLRAHTAIALHWRTSHQTVTSRAARSARNCMQARRRDAHGHRPWAFTALHVLPQGLVCQAPLSAGPSRLERIAYRPPPAPPRPYLAPAYSPRFAPPSPDCFSSLACLHGTAARMRGLLRAFCARAHSAQLTVALRLSARRAGRQTAALRRPPLASSTSAPSVPARSDSPTVRCTRARQCARALALAHPCAPPHRAEPLPARSTQPGGSRDVPSGITRSPNRSGPPCGRAQGGGAATRQVAHWPRGHFGPLTKQKGERDGRNRM